MQQNTKVVTFKLSHDFSCQISMNISRISDFTNVLILTLGSIVELYLTKTIDYTGLCQASDESSWGLNASSKVGGKGWRPQY